MLVAEAVFGQKIEVVPRLIRPLCDFAEGGFDLIPNALANASMNRFFTASASSRSVNVALLLRLLHSI